MLFLQIRAPFDPNLFSAGVFAVTWHAALTFVSVCVGLILAGRWARSQGLTARMVSEVAVWAVFGGIVGARLLHAADHWHLYRHSPLDILALWQGGMALWGAILGGWAAGALYAGLARYPVGRLMDAAAPAVLVAQVLGRVGTVINGEVLSRSTELPWGIYYTHPDSPGRINAERMYGDPGQAVHPVAALEIAWNLALLAIVWNLRGRLAPPGSLWMLYLGGYALGRFAIQWLRVDPLAIAGMQSGQLIALACLAVVVPYFLMRTVRIRPSTSTGDWKQHLKRRLRRPGRGDAEAEL